MPDKWEPNVPPVDEEFSKQSNQTPDIATTAELKKLRDQVEMPVREHRLTIGGSIEQETHTQVSQTRNERIKHLEERLGAARHNLRKNFRNSTDDRNPDTPALKDDFNRASRGRKI